MFLAKIAKRCLSSKHIGGGRQMRARVRKRDDSYTAPIDWGTNSPGSGSPRDAWLRPDARFAALGVPSLLLGKLGRLGAEIPSEAQASMLPALFSSERRDLVVRAPTGSGKTLGYLLPAVHAALEGAGSKSLRALIVTPTRELAIQVESVAQSLVMGGSKRRKQETHKDITVRRFVGTITQERLSTLRSDPPQLAVGTPQTLCALIPRHLAVGDADIVVFDEADLLMAPHQRRATKQLLRDVTRVKRRPRVVLVSATTSIGLRDAKRKFLLPNTETIDLMDASESDLQVAPTVDHGLLTCTNWNQKPAMLLDVLRALSPPLTLVLCESELRAEALGAFLEGRSIPTVTLVASCSNRERSRILSKVSSNKASVIVSTDMASRGLDLPSLALVVDFDPSRSPRQYVHRAGRSGRLGGARGTMLTLATEGVELDHVSTTLNKLSIDKNKVNLQLDTTVDPPILRTKTQT